MPCRGDGGRVATAVAAASRPRPVRRGLRPQRRPRRRSKRPRRRRRPSSSQRLQGGQGAGRRPRRWPRGAPSATPGRPRAGRARARAPCPGDGGGGRRRPTAGAVRGQAGASRLCERHRGRAGVRGGGGRRRRRRDQRSLQRRGSRPQTRTTTTRLRPARGGRAASSGRLPQQRSGARRRGLPRLGGAQSEGSRVPRGERRRRRPGLGGGGRRAPAPQAPARPAAPLASRPRSRQTRHRGWPVQPARDEPPALRRRHWCARGSGSPSLFLPPPERPGGAAGRAVPDKALATANDEVLTVTGN